MKTYFPYDPTSPRAVEGEEHVIVHGQIRLDHVPLEGSLEIRGFRRAQSLANLQSNEFFCQYRADTLYREANRIVYFWAGRSGQTVYASYQAVASPITADDMNEISTRLDTSEGRLDSHDSTLADVKNNIIVTQNEFRTNLTAHNTDRDAHGDIRNALADEIQTRQSADSNLQTRLNNFVLEVGTETSARIDGDSNLQSQLDNEISTRQSEVASLNTALANEITIRQNEVAGLSSSLANEITIRQNEVAGLSSSLANEVTTRQSEVAGLSTALANEVTTRQSEVAGLSAAITNEVTNRQSEVAGLSTAITNEITTRQSEVAGLSTALANEVTTRQSEVAGLSSSLANEVTTRQNEVAGLSSSLANEITTRQSEVAGLSSSLADEVSNLQTQIDGIPHLSAGAGVSIVDNKINVTLETGGQALVAGDNITISGNTIKAADTTYNTATTSQAGLMSAADKSKLNNLASITTAGANVTISGGTIKAANTTYSVATTSTSGLMSSTDKAKLDNLASITTAGDGVTIQNGVISASGNALDEETAQHVTDFFATEPLLKTRYATSPFDSTSIFGLDLSNLIDGNNFELETLADGSARIRSGPASYNVNNGISRGYVKVDTFVKCTLTVIYSISSQASYDYGGCIVSTGSPNTTFTYANLKSANFFAAAGNSANVTKTYTLAKNTTYYLNFGYAKNASTNSNDDRFYIHTIRVVPEIEADSRADYFFDSASELAELADTVIANIGGKLYPTVNTRQGILTYLPKNAAYLVHKLDTLLINTAFFTSDFGSRTTAEFRNGDAIGADLFIDDNYDGNGKNRVTFNDSFVTLASDTSTVEYEYSVYKLSETAGFINQISVNTSTDTSGQKNIIPFKITSSGTVSLGSNTSICAAAPTGCESSWEIVPSIYDPHHLLFFTTTKDANDVETYRYTTICFNGATGAFTRTKALTTIGTSATIKKIETTTFGLCYQNEGDADAGTHRYLIHHGMYRAVPVAVTVPMPDNNLTSSYLTRHYLNLNKTDLFFFNHKYGNVFNKADTRIPHNRTLIAYKLDATKPAMYYDYIGPNWLMA